MITNSLSAVDTTKCPTVREAQLMILRAAIEMAERGELSGLVLTVVHERDVNGDCGSTLCSVLPSERKHLGDHAADFLDVLHAKINSAERRKGMN